MELVEVLYIILRSLVFILAIPIFAFYFLRPKSSVYWTVALIYVINLVLIEFIGIQSEYVEKLADAFEAGSLAISLFVLIKIVRHSYLSKKRSRVECISFLSFLSFFTAIFFIF